MNLNFNDEIDWNSLPKKKRKRSFTELTEQNFDAIVDFLSNNDKCVKPTTETLKKLSVKIKSVIQKRKLPTNLWIEFCKFTSNKDFGNNWKLDLYFFYRSNFQKHFDIFLNNLREKNK
jgi:hypothetical protein